MQKQVKERLKKIALEYQQSILQTINLKNRLKKAEKYISEKNFSDNETEKIFNEIKNYESFAKEILLNKNILKLLEKFNGEIIEIKIMQH